MLIHITRLIAYAAFSAALLATPETGLLKASRASQDLVEAALTNIMTLQRPGQDGLATIWEGNKYVQCRWMTGREFRCEAAGALMQPSLRRVLSPERIGRLATLGWHLDNNFGNYVQFFPAGWPASEVAQKILQILKEGYEADLAELEVRTDWIRSSPCPPRNGPTQNLAGMINDSAEMAATAVHGCFYRPGLDQSTTAARTAGDLITIYAARVSGEIQRLRVNSGRQIFFVLDTGGGYIQCGPSSARAIYCEAQSADSWPVLARILTPDRIARLRAAGFADPGRAPNYWKIFQVGDSSDVAIASELLTLLHDVYGYDGSPKLEFATEKGRE
jgi:hypothetical protein